MAIGVITALIATTYVACEGDTLRLVCHRHYGRSDSAILKVVAERNPYILEKLVFSGGDKVILPATNPVPSKGPKIVKLWNSTAFVGAVQGEPEKIPTKVPTVKLLALLDAYRRRKVVPVPDEEPPEPRPPLPYYTAIMDWKSIDDPYSLLTDPLANLI